MLQKKLSDVLEHIGTSQEINETLNLLKDGFLESSLASCRDNRLRVLELLNEIKHIM
jgi:hypothetical protein